MRTKNENDMKEKSNIIELTKVDRIARISANLKLRCSVLDSILGYIVKKGIIKEDASDELKTAVGREIVCGNASSLKEYIREGLKGIKGAVMRTVMGNALADLDKAIDRAVEVYSSEYRRRLNEGPCRFLTNQVAAAYIFYEQGMFMFDDAKVKRDNTLRFDSERSQDLIARARNLQRELAAFDKLCARYGLNGTNDQWALLTKDADGKWWLDPRMLEGATFGDGPVEMIDTDSLDNVGERNFTI